MRNINNKFTQNRHNYKVFRNPFSSKQLLKPIFEQRLLLYDFYFVASVFSLIINKINTISQFT